MSQKNRQHQRLNPYIQQLGTAGGEETAPQIGQKTVKLHSWEQSFVDTVSAKGRGTSERAEATETVQRVTRKNADAINSSRASKGHDGKRFQTASEAKRQRFAQDKSKQASRRDKSSPFS